MEAEEGEIDTLHRQIYQCVVEDIPKAVHTYSAMVKARRKLLEQISKLIEPIDVKRLGPDEISNYKIAGARARCPVQIPCDSRNDSQRLSKKIHQECKAGV